MSDYTSMTNEQLIAELEERDEDIATLETEKEQLQDDNDKLSAEIEDLRDQAVSVERMRERLEEAVDLAVAAGKCHDTPHARRQWVEV